MTQILRVRVALSGDAVVGGGVATHYFQNTTLEAQDCVDAVGVLWGTLDGDMTPDLSWATEAEVDVVEDTTGITVDAVITTPTSGVGTMAGDMLPPMCQGLITWRTNAFPGGRRLIGHTYLPGMGEGNSDASGRPLAAWQTRTSDAAEAFVETPVVQPCVLSRAYGTSVFINSDLVPLKWAVLRSRRD